MTRLIQRPCSYYNTAILLNLAISDCVMDVTLLVVGFKSAEFSGKYCYNDYHWRSSNLCNVVGIMTVVSSETSLTMLVLLTAMRLYIVVYPFRASELRVKVVYLLIAAAWLVPVALAVAPVLEVKYFAKAYLIVPSRYYRGEAVSVGDIKKNYVRTNMLLRAGKYHLVNNTDRAFSFSTFAAWFFQTDKGKELFPNRDVKVTDYFGYYSTNSVCFPDYYSKYSPAAEYSLALISYNALSLLFIFISYTVIYLKSKKSQQLVQHKAMEKLG